MTEQLPTRSVLDRAFRPKHSDGGLSTTVSASPVGAEPAVSLVGSRLGRFELGELIGKGGMGRVYRAYDPALDRDVAVKLLARHQAPGAQTRFLREAQAMASVSHTNVLPVYDVGRVELETGDGGLFIAMELVEGQTLRAWLKQRTRSRAEILEVFIHAGRGLAAVHALGLLHRDFKPSNVMVGNDGRVRVMDFGLARVAGSLDDEDRDLTVTPRSLDIWLTRSGTVRGTPAYMAPEQYRRAALDERCDQYSYCVALWEALYGVRPFVGKDMDALMEAKRTSSPRSPPGATVPLWLDRLLRQGLAAEPTERHKSVAALVQQLDRRTKRKGRWLLWSGVLGAAAVVASVLPPVWSTEGPCHSASKLAGVWDDERREQTQASILATGLAHAPDAWQRIEPRLNDYADRWVAARDEACVAAQSKQAHSEELLDGRMRCLNTRLGHLQALVETVATSAPSVLDEVVVELDRLPPLEPCADDHYVLGLTPLPPNPDQRSKIEALELDLARVRAREYTGDYAQARALLEQALPQAESLGYDPLKAEATLLMGLIYEHSHEHTKAAQLIEQAYFTATALELSELRVEAAVQLVFTNAVREGHYDEALEWAAHARSVLKTRPDDYWQAELMDNLGTAHKENDQPVLAIEAYERARSIYEQQLGLEHPEVASTLNHLATVYYSQGRLDESLASYQQALTINEQALGPIHPRVGLTLHGLGNVYEAHGDLERALEYYERAWEISKRTHGPDGTANLSIMLCLASVHAARGEHDQALDYYGRALSIARVLFGPDSLDEIEILYELGLAYEQQGNLDEAEAHLRQAVHAGDRTERSKERIIAESLASLGRVQLALHHPVDARVTLERAVSLFEKSERALSPERAAVRFGLARALVESEVDVERARDLASTARDEYDAVEEDYSSAVAEITAWLDALHS